MIRPFADFSFQFENVTKLKPIEQPGCPLEARQALCVMVLSHICKWMCVFLFLLLYFPLDKETQGHEVSTLEAKETLEHLKK